MRITETAIPGLLIIDLDVHSDNRGWFKENWQRENSPASRPSSRASSRYSTIFLLTTPEPPAACTPSRGTNSSRWRTARSSARGAIYARIGELWRGRHPRGGAGDSGVCAAGVANGFQALEETSYCYLVNEHWSAEARYAAVNLDIVDWPLEPTEISDKDKQHPDLAEVSPMPARRILVTGANGQLGRALKRLLADAEFCSHADFDITNPPERNWKQYSAIINCAAYNDVNGAENDRAAAWAVNAEAPARLARIAAENQLTLVHVSSDYIFDGANEVHSEEELPSPLSVYGASKAAGDTAAQTAPQHYVIRTSWVFGDGENFMSTMRRLAAKGVEPKVIHDQRGRPTFAEDLAKGIVHLLNSDADYGVYNLSNSGDTVGRDEIAMAVVHRARPRPGRGHSGKHRAVPRDRGPRGAAP